jgi:hypothetical protein
MTQICGLQVFFILTVNAKGQQCPLNAATDGSKPVTNAEEEITRNHVAFIVIAGYNRYIREKQITPLAIRGSVDDKELGFK